METANLDQADYGRAIDRARKFSYVVVPLGAVTVACGVFEWPPALLGFVWLFLGIPGLLVVIMDTSSGF